jgi:hypothetical protein
MKPGTGPMTFDDCMARSWPGVADKEAFCAEMHRGTVGKRDNSHGLVCTIKSINKEKRLVTVVTNRVAKADGTPYVDHDGDVISIDNLEDVFIKSFFDERLSEDGGGEMHRSSGGVDVVQWFTLSQDERVALGFGQGDEMGIAKLRVNNDCVWKRVKSGEYPEVSIEGLGTREPLNA